MMKKQKKKVIPKAPSVVEITTYIVLGEEKPNEDLEEVPVEEKCVKEKSPKKRALSVPPPSKRSREILHGSSGRELEVCPPKESSQTIIGDFVSKVVGSKGMQEVPGESFVAWAITAKVSEAQEIQVGDSSSGFSITGAAKKRAQKKEKKAGMKKQSCFISQQKDFTSDPWLKALTIRIRAPP